MDRYTQYVSSGRAGPIRVLIVDDSVVIRRLVRMALDDDPAFEIVGVAANGAIALQKVEQLQPDVVTLDIEMPEMDGLEALREIRRRYPRLRVVMFSTLTRRGGEHTLDALSLGADDYVTKAANAGAFAASLEHLRSELAPKIKQFFAPQPPATPAVTPARGAATAPVVAPVRLVAIGVSTGGPNALAVIFHKLPATIGVPIVITQHMPPMFTRLLAERLDARSSVRVCEAEEGMPLEPGLALIAPGGRHLTLARSGAQVVAQLNEDPPENSCRPAVDVMYRSAARVYGPGVLAVILTGMGKDGLAGAEALKSAGSRVIAQDKASSVVWGMPGHVVEAGLADAVATLDSVASEVLRFVQAGCRRSSILQRA